VLVSSGVGTTSTSADEAHYFERVVPTGAHEISAAASRDSTDAERQLLARGIATSYDPTGGQLQGSVHPAGSNGSGAGTHSSGGGRAEPVKVKITDVAAFLMMQGPREGPVQCLITREKDSLVGKNHKWVRRVGVIVLGGGSAAGWIVDARVQLLVC